MYFIGIVVHLGFRVMYNCWYDLEQLSSTHHMNSDWLKKVPT